MVWKKCENCGKETEMHSKNLCTTCYKKLLWKPKKQICKRCKREMVLHAKGLCPGCYNFVFHLEKNKKWNKEKYHGIGLEIYKKITKKCAICGFDKIVELHHLDENKKNNDKENLVGLCPNHHKMFHNSKFREEITKILRERGFRITENQKANFDQSDLSGKTLYSQL